ncbi:thiamine-phosphate pyrophosphorylase [Motilibacter peucedani]|uniref:Thiamine-phosphate synthase n=1 Tax=Motilibacter peucedani TaxID=598650 RepID=A0A420XLI2_9ACTN|nr:thiamine phosphate synthase [Motilibacter peucedani]RKS71273.1 thiamine-phosphate pyrophosphorylase [Motilibacter peucedani]
MTADLRVYLVTDPALGGERPLEATVEAAVVGGVTAVQLRHKGASPSELFVEARRLLQVLDGTGVPLLVNDSLPVATELGLGLHVGRADPDPVLARQVLGRDVVIGMSLYGGRRLADDERSALDYTAVGPVWATSTKSDAGGAVGTGAIGATDRSRPVVAIGGIDPDRARQAVAAGASGVAVVSAVMAAADPRAAAAALRAAVDEALAARS